MAIRKKYSIRLKKNTWKVDYYDQEGVRRLSKAFTKQSDAKAFEHKMSVEKAGGIHTPDSTSVTVAEAAEAWIRGRELDGIDRTTLRQYRQHIDLHIVPLVGKMKLSRLTAPKVETYKEALLKSRSRAMATKALQSLRSILTDAQRRGTVAQNTARGISISSRGREKKRLEVGVDIPSLDEMRQMLTNASDRWRPLLLTTAFTGLRSGELRGLAWDDVDLDAQVITVRQRADRWNDIGQPKSETSQRQVPIPQNVANTLKEWKLACPPGGLVFPNGNGNVESGANIWNRGLKPPQLKLHIVDKEGKAKYSLHAFRHFYASWLINEKEAGGLEQPPKRVQEWLGHANIEITMNTYSHLFPKPKNFQATLDAGALTVIS